MKNQIVTCIKDNHTICDSNFRENNIKIGKSYKCVNELVLTSKDYYNPEFASLQGITIRSHIYRWGWSRPCFPKECFRLATKDEIKRYKFIFAVNTPFRLFKRIYFKIFNKIDRIVRRKYYKELEEMF